MCPVVTILNSTVQATILYRFTKGLVPLKKLVNTRIQTVLVTTLVYTGCSSFTQNFISIFFKWPFLIHYYPQYMEILPPKYSTNNGSFFGFLPLARRRNSCCTCSILDTILQPQLPCGQLSAQAHPLFLQVGQEFYFAIYCRTSNFLIGV